MHTLLLLTLLGSALAVMAAEIDTNSVVPESEFAVSSLPEEELLQDPLSDSIAGIVDDESDLERSKEEGWDTKVYYNEQTKRDMVKSPGYVTGDSSTTPDGHYELGTGRRRIGAGFGRRRAPVADPNAKPPDMPLEHIHHEDDDLLKYVPRAPHTKAPGHLTKDDRARIEATLMGIAHGPRIFKDCNYKGGETAPGKSMPRTDTFSSSTIGSLVIPAGWCVELYAQREYVGNSVKFCGPRNVGCLGKHTIMANFEKTMAATVDPESSAAAAAVGAEHRQGRVSLMRHTNSIKMTKWQYRRHEVQTECPSTCGQPSSMLDGNITCQRTGGLQAKADVELGVCEKLGLPKQNPLSKACEATGNCVHWVKTPYHGVCAKQCGVPAKTLKGKVQCREVAAGEEQIIHPAESAPPSQVHEEAAESTTPDTDSAQPALAPVLTDSIEHSPQVKTTPTSLEALPGTGGFNNYLFASKSHPVGDASSGVIGFKFKVPSSAGNFANDMMIGLGVATISDGFNPGIYSDFKYWFHISSGTVGAAFKMQNGQVHQATRPRKTAAVLDYWIEMAINGEGKMEFKFNDEVFHTAVDAFSWHGPLGVQGSLGNYDLSGNLQLFTDIGWVMAAPTPVPQRSLSYLLDVWNKKKKAEEALSSSALIELDIEAEVRSLVDAPDSAAAPTAVKVSPQSSMSTLLDEWNKKNNVGKGRCFCDNDFSTPAATYYKADDLQCGALGSGAPGFNSVYDNIMYVPPTGAPTAAPTGSPTTSPTAAPTDSPTMAPTAAPTPIPNFLGCFVDDAQHDLQFGPKTAGFNASSCMAACPSYAYIALQDNVCYCDVHYATPPTTYTKAPDTECGARGFGAPERNAIYSNVLHSPPIPSFLGCFMDDAAHDLQHGPQVADPTIKFSSGRLNAQPAPTDFVAAVDAAITNSPYCSKSLQDLSGYSNQKTCAASTTNVAFKIELEFVVAEAGTWEFDFNVDFGWGGVVYFDGEPSAEGYQDGDHWWAGNTDKALPLDLKHEFTATGHHTMVIYGGEGCCDGTSNVRFKKPGQSSWQTLSVANLKTKVLGFTTSSCMAACTSYKYIALQAGGVCYCDNDFSTPAASYVKVSNSDCNQGGQGLGGNGRNAVYTNEQYVPPTQAPTQAPTASPTASPTESPTPEPTGAPTAAPSPIPNFLGCYMDDSDRDLQHGPQSPGHSAESCMAECTPYKFIALQGGGGEDDDSDSGSGSCYCDNSYGDPGPTYLKVADDQCGSLGGGGALRNAIYSNVQYVPPTMAPTPPPTPPTPAPTPPTVAPTPAPTVPEGYVGCFVDDQQRDLKGHPLSGIVDGYSSARRCMMDCPDYKYVAIQNNDECFCDNDYSTPADQYPQVDDQECNPNGLLQGGPFRNAVYINKFSRANKAPSSLLGCFTDIATDRDLRFGPQQPGYTLESCSDACVMFQYVSLQNGGTCFCDNAYSGADQNQPHFQGKYPQVLDSECSGNDWTGGPLRNAIYGNDKFESSKQLPDNYVGCYKEDADHPDLTAGPRTDVGDPYVCAMECGGYKYYALSSGVCTCDNSYGDGDGGIHTRALATDCQGEWGAPGFNAIYESDQSDSGDDDSGGSGYFGY